MQIIAIIVSIVILVAITEFRTTKNTEKMSLFPKILFFLIVINIAIAFYSYFFARSVLFIVLIIVPSIFFLTVLLAFSLGLRLKNYIFSRNNSSNQEFFGKVKKIHIKTFVSVTFFLILPLTTHVFTEITDTNADFSMALTAFFCFTVYLSFFYKEIYEHSRSFITFFVSTSIISLFFRDIAGGLMIMCFATCLATIIILEKELNATKVDPIDKYMFYFYEKKLIGIKDFNEYSLEKLLDLKTRFEQLLVKNKLDFDEIIALTDGKCMFAGVDLGDLAIDSFPEWLDIYFYSQRISSKIETYVFKEHCVLDTNYEKMEIDTSAVIFPYKSKTWYILKTYKHSLDTILSFSKLCEDCDCDDYSKVEEVIKKSSELQLQIPPILAKKLVLQYRNQSVIDDLRLFYFLTELEISKRYDLIIENIHHKIGDEILTYGKVIFITYDEYNIIYYLQKNDTYHFILGKYIDDFEEYIAY